MMQQNTSAVIADPETSNLWYERPYETRHDAQSEAFAFLNRYADKIKSVGRYIEKEASQGNIGPFIKHIESLENNISQPPIGLSALEAAQQFQNKYNLQFNKEQIPAEDYTQLLYHDAFQHGIPEQYVGVVDKTLPNVLTAADEARAVLQQTLQGHRKYNVDPSRWHTLASTITMPQQGFDLIKQEVDALLQQNPNVSQEVLKQQAIQRFPSLSSVDIQNLKSNVLDPYLQDLNVSEKLTQADRLKAGLEKFASKTKSSSTASTEAKDIVDAAMSKLKFY